MNVNGMIGIEDPRTSDTLELEELGGLTLICLSLVPGQ